MIQSTLRAQTKLNYLLKSFLINRKPICMNFLVEEQQCLSLLYFPSVQTSKINWLPFPCFEIKIGYQISNLRVIFNFLAYLKAVGYNSTVAVLRTLEPIPLAMRTVRKPIWRDELSVSIQAIPQAPVPAKTETIGKLIDWFQFTKRTVTFRYWHTYDREFRNSINKNGNYDGGYSIQGL